MTSSIEQTITALGRMTAAQLRDQYLEVFCEPSRSGNRDFLFKRIAWRIQANAEGGLSERAKRRAEELARDADLRTTLPRPSKAVTGSHWNGLLFFGLAKTGKQQKGGEA